MGSFRRQTLLVITLLGFLWAQFAITQHSVEHELLHGNHHCELELGLSQAGHAVAAPALPVVISYKATELDYTVQDNSHFRTFSSKGYHAHAPPLSIS